MSGAVSFAPFSRPLLTPFVYGHHSLANRHGFLLRLVTPEGTFYSEASPLPGHSTDTIAEVEKVLRERSSQEILHGEAELPASLRFAVDALEAQGKAGTYPVRSNALLRWSGLADARMQLLKLASAGYTHYKLKISAKNWEEQLALLEEFPKFVFRLDANLGLSAPILERLLKELQSRGLASHVDYIEEPFAGVWSSDTFRDCAVALAADESAATSEAAFTLLKAANPPSVLIVKPTVMGGLASLAPVLKAFRAAGKRFVFTSAIETEVGRRSILAFLSQTPQEVAGLSTGSLFRENFLPDQALWTKIPSPGTAELAMLESLDWKACR